MATQAIAYLRTSSATNVEGDSAPRQRAAINRYTKRARLELAYEFYDAAVSGADAIDKRPGFSQALAYAQEHGVTVMIVEEASRFARDLTVQLTGHDMLKRLGITLIAANAPDYFTDDTPTATMVRQILGAVAQFDKATLVAKLKGARDRKSVVRGRRIEGRRGYGETRPELVKEAKRLARRSPKTGKARSLREIAAELAGHGYTTASGSEFSAAQVQRLVRC